MFLSISAFLVATLLPLTAIPTALLYLALRRTRRQLPICDDDAEEALPYAVYASAFLLECLATATTAALVLVGGATPRRYGRGDAATRIVLMHGLAPGRGTVAVLARRLAARGFGVVCYSYRSLTGDVATAAEGLRRLVDDLQRERPGPVHLIGFGIGGLVARACVRRHRVPGVRRLITLGTPHLGTLLAPSWAGGLARLRPDSDLIRQLAAADRSPDQFEATAIQSELDATILPPDNAYYPAAFNVIVRDSGHFTLLYSRRIFDLLAENLGDGEVG